MNKINHIDEYYPSLNYERVKRIREVMKNVKTPLDRQRCVIILNSVYGMYGRDSYEKTHK